ncbi:YkyA family protein [Bacillus paramycoides]|uniref:YkyA family protein n=1 Tax=Bacillus paramycoides TaxID=2026194 RepID=UPI0037FB7869
MIYRKVALITILSIGLLGGCLGAKPEEELYVAFENAANQEKPLFDNVKILKKLEIRGQELYNQIIEEGKVHNEPVIQEIEQAIIGIDARGGLLEDEKVVLEKAQKEVTAVHGYINKIEDKKLQTQAKQVEESYKKRYESFQKISENYTKSLKIEKELYEKLKDKDTKLKEINETVTAFNILNEEILKEKEKFNQYTKSYNVGKLAFYKEAKIKIKEIKQEK